MSRKTELLKRVIGVLEGRCANDESQEEWLQKFPVGSKVRENRQGAPVETVRKVVQNTIYTDRGSMHATKAVRA